MICNFRSRLLFKAIGLAIVSAGVGCSNKNEIEYVDFGLKWPLPDKELEQIPYRLFDIASDKKEEPTLKKTADLVRVVLDLQAGRGQGKSILLNVNSCSSPGVRQGLPMVRCTSPENGDVYVVGDQTVRERLLKIPANELQMGVVYGHVIGLLFKQWPVVKVMP